MHSRPYEQSKYNIMKTYVSCGRWMVALKIKRNIHQRVVVHLVIGENGNCGQVVEESTGLCHVLKFLNVGEQTWRDVMVYKYYLPCYKPL